MKYNIRGDCYINMFIKFKKQNPALPIICIIFVHSAPFLNIIYRTILLPYTLVRKKALGNNVPSNLSFVSATQLVTLICVHIWS